MLIISWDKVNRERENKGKEGRGIILIVI